MASIGKDRNGRKRILFVAADGSRKTIRLGKASLKQADNFKVGLEALIAARITGSLDAKTARWVAELEDDMHKKLAAVGLVLARDATSAQDSLTVGKMVDGYIERRPDVKPITRGKWQNAANKMSAFFKDQPIDEITVQQAKGYRVYLKSTLGLEENTVRRLIGLARQFFNDAIDAEIITKNPFKGKDQPVTIRANKSRFFFVAMDMSIKVLEECPDAQWGLIFGLARWGGLRCPSEILRLKWQDVDFEHNQFTVHAIKTEHHEDGGIRSVPMFPELRPLFQEAFDRAKEGDVFCITRYRDKSTNLRTQLTKIIRRTGLEPWPKLFQNMRSTRETELFKMTNGNVKAVCSWIGNSPQVALEHYAQVTEEDLQEAAKMSLLGEGAAQNPAQYPAASSSKEQKANSEEYSESAYFPQDTGLYCSAHNPQLPETGVEPARPEGH